MEEHNRITCLVLELLEPVTQLSIFHLVLHPHIRGSHLRARYLIIQIGFLMVGRKGVDEVLKLWEG